MDEKGSQLETGSVIGGYRLDALISRGGMGVVYRATNLSLNKIYALKVLAPELADDEHFRDRFKREIRIAASLNHPNVVAIHYAGEHDGMLFLAMDLVDGTNLSDVVARTGRLDPHRAVDLLVQICSALDAAHRKGLVHRDVKPANVLMKVEDGEERAFLTDFGLAKRFDAPTALTVKGAVVGTVDYMPPEQITGNHTDARSDIYAVGCVLFQMLTGKVPYEREHSVATLFAHVYDPPPALEGSVAASHPTLGPVIAKAMAKDPADRYLSAGDLARDALAALDGARYAGPATIVGTGEARPDDSSAEAPAAQADAASRGAESDLATEIRDGSQHPPFVEDVPSRSAPAPVAGAEATVIGQGVGTPAAPVGPVSADSGSTAPSGGHTSGGGPAGRSSSRRRGALAGAAVLLAGGVVAAVIALTSGSSTPAPSGLPFGAKLGPVPTNRVTATGKATVRLHGDVATVTVSTEGLLNGAPHAMHIHGGGLGICPPASAARRHNGNLSISTTDGIKYYGDALVSLTTRGDTSPRSIIDFTRYPTTGNIRYARTFTVSASAAAAIRRDNAVIVVHGIDYNGNGVYDNVLDRSELSNSLTGESTAPALCGKLAPATQTAAAVRGHRSGDGTVYTATLTVREVPMTGPSMFWCDGGLAAESEATAPQAVLTRRA